MEARVLSIQSHVVHGYVGNKRFGISEYNTYFDLTRKYSAVFPLQLLGYDVDIINTVQFSNHTGYSKGFRGSKLKAEEYLTLFDGLQMNDLVQSTTHILQGYCPTADLLRNIHQTSLV